MGPALVTRCNDYKAQFAQMTNKVKEGVAERKRLHNVIQELKGNIRVYLRCRPPSQKELGQFGQDAQCVSFPLASVGLDGASEGGSMVRVVNEKGRDKTWEFDQVFDLNSTQEGVYKEVSELVTSMMDGFNVCIFAYGQTGSGKTFTMAGPPGNCGVNSRALEELFNKSRARRNDYNDVITVSVLEVYNEDIRDLLTESNGEKLEVRQSTDGSGSDYCACELSAGRGAAAWYCRQVPDFRQHQHERALESLTHDADSLCTERKQTQRRCISW